MFKTILSAILLTGLSGYANGGDTGSGNVESVALYSGSILYRPAAFDKVNSQSPLSFEILREKFYNSGELNAICDIDGKGYKGMAPNQMMCDGLEYKILLGSRVIPVELHRFKNVIDFMIQHGLGSNERVLSLKKYTATHIYGNKVSMPVPLLTLSSGRQCLLTYIHEARADQATLSLYCEDKYRISSKNANPLPNLFYNASAGNDPNQDRQIIGCQSEYDVNILGASKVIQCLQAQFVCAHQDCTYQDQIPVIDLSKVKSISELMPSGFRDQHNPESLIPDARIVLKGPRFFQSENSFRAILNEKTFKLKYDSASDIFQFEGL